MSLANKNDTVGSSVSTVRSVEPANETNFIPAGHVAGLAATDAIVANDLREPANDAVSTGRRLLQRRRTRWERRAVRAL
ncbi:MAG: hypothetical protein MI723_19155 [Caulobacterales bacterium]|nr:hypothetical protein [Caulobacterales bacterium]